MSYHRTHVTCHITASGVRRPTHPLQRGRRHEEGNAVAEGLQRCKHGWVGGAARLERVEQSVLDGVHVAGGKRHEEVAQGVAGVGAVWLLQNGAHDGHEHAKRVT